MLDSLLDPESQMPRSKLFWPVLGSVLVLQVVALWFLCSHQVRKAEARNTEVQLQQMAMADCLQFIPGATIATCTSRILGPAEAAPAPENALLTGSTQAAAGDKAGATRVSYTR
jgi:hypothetical protein